MDSSTAARIRQLSADGMGQRTIAAEVGVTRWAVRTVLADEPRRPSLTLPSSAERLRRDWTRELFSVLLAPELPDAEPDAGNLWMHAFGRLAAPTTGKRPAGRPRKHAQNTTRMLRVECPSCGCLLRMTRTWIDRAGLPSCGCGARMAECPVYSRA